MYLRLRSVLLTIIVLALVAPVQAHNLPVHRLPNPFTPFTPPHKAAPAATGTTTSTPLGSLQQITVADLTNALADSNAQVPPAGSPLSAQAPFTMPPGVAIPPVVPTVTPGSDTRHGNCWAALSVFLQDWNATNILPSAPGLAELQQKIFDDQQLLGKPLIPDYVALNCALTLLDAKLNLAQLAGLIGIKAITLPTIPGL